MFAGWTASDLVSSTEDMAQFAGDLYGRKILDEKLLEHMVGGGGG